MSLKTRALRNGSIVALVAGALAACTSDAPLPIDAHVAQFATRSDALVGGAPTARQYHTAVWDTVRNRELMFGGEDFNGVLLNDVSSLTVSGGSAFWVSLAPTGTAPSARKGMSSVWDAANSRMIVFGGYNNTTYFNDVWTLTCSSATACAWAQVSTAGTAPARHLHTAVWDPAQSRMIVYAGTGASNLSDVVQLSFAGGTPTWSTLSPTGTAPGFRYDHVAVWDAANNRMLVNGGRNGSGYLGDTVALSFNSSPPSWSALASTTTRSAGTGVWDAANARLITYGGWTGGTHKNDTQVYASGTWTTLSPGGTIAAGREHTASVWDPVNTQMIVFSGEGGGNINDTLVLTFSGSTSTWTTLTAQDCDSSPVAPTLSSPANSATLTTCSPTFSWTDSGVSGHTYSVIVNGQTVASGLTSTSYTLSSSATLLASGNTWQVISTGCVGSTATSASRTFDLPATPTPSLTSPANGVLSGPTPSFSWTAAGAAAGVTYTVLVDGSAIASGLTTTSYTVPIASKLANGTHSWSVKAVGCLNSSATSTSRSLTVDGTPPATFSLSSPADNTWYAGGTVDLTWEASSDPDSGIASYVAGLTGPQSISLPAGTSTSVTWSLTAVTEGLYTWSVVATDGVGNTRTSTSTRRIGVDRTAPAVPSGLSPASNAYVSTTPTLRWTAPSETGSGICSYTVTLDGIPQTPVTTTSFPVTSALSPVAHTWSVAATDCVGNSGGASATLTFNIDTTPPSVPALISPADNGYGSLQPTFKWSASTDSGSGICGYAVTLDGSSQSVSNTTSFTWPTTISAGTHSWTAQAVDCAGNMSNAAISNTFSTDETAPGMVTISTPATNEIVGPSNPYLTWTDATDDLAGVSVYRIYLNSNAAPAGTTPYSTRAFNILSVAGSGANCMTVKAEDAVGNLGPGATRCFTVDITAPGVPVLTSPTSSSYTTGTPTFTWQASTDAVSGLCGYIPVVDGTSYTQQTGTTLTLPATLSSGSHSWTVRSVDCVGNQSANATTRSFTVDVTAPAAPVLSLPATNTFISTTSQAISWSPASDSQSGVCSYVVILDGVDQSSSTGTTASITNLTEGQHLWSVRARDCVGNESSPATARRITVDRTGPSAVTITSPEEGLWLGTARPTVTWLAATDAGSGVSSYAIAVDTVSAGTTTSLSFTPGSNFSNGQHCVSVQASDALGNFSASTTRCFKIDTTAPAAPTDLVPATSTYVGTQTPTLSWSAVIDSGSGICGYIPIVDSVSLTQQTATSLVTSTLATGSHSWSVKAVDCVGLQSVAATTQIFTIDLGAPTTPTLTSPTGGTFVGSARPSLTWSAATDVLSGICSYVITVDGSDVVQSGTGTSYTPPTSLSEGQHSWTVSARDCVGNAGSAPSAGSFVVDTTGAGLVSFVSPAEGAWLNNQKPTVTWNAATDSGSGIASYKVSVDSGAPTTQTSASTSFTPSTNLSAGQHCVAVTAVDAVGNSGLAATRCFKIDVTLPVFFGIVTPEAGSYVGDVRPSFTWFQGSDAASGVCGYSVILDGTPSSQQTGTTYVPSTDLTEGAHSWNVRVVDCAGNERTSSSFSFNVDLTAPSVVSLLTPVEGALVATDNPTFSWTQATATGSALCGYVFTLDGNAQNLDTTQAAYHPSGTQTSGPHTWSVRSVDCVGNVSAASATGHFTVDTSVPSKVTITAPDNGAWIGNARPTVTWTAATDAISGVSHYRLQIDSGNVAIVPHPTTSYDVPTALTEGNHCAVVRAVDLAGNYGAATTRCFNVDLTAPSTPIILAPAAGAFTSSATPTLTWTTATDSGSGVCGYIPTIDGSDLPQQAATSLTTAALAEGTHSWSVRTVDCVGLEGTPVSSSFKVDLTAPTVATLVSPVGGVYVASARPTLTWSGATDSGSGICGSIVTIDSSNTTLSTTATTFIPISALSDGLHTWTVRSVDCVGLTASAATSATFRVDTTGPGVVTILSPEENVWLAAVRPEIEWLPATDSGSGVNGYSVVVDSDLPISLAEATTFFSPLSDLTEGQHCVTVTAVDAVGNAGSSALRCFRVDVAAPPAPTGLAPAGLVFGATTSPVLSWSPVIDSGSGVCGYIPTIDGADQDLQVGTSFSAPTSFSEGLHPWTVRAVDCVGHEGATAAPAFFQMDYTAPTVPTLLGPSGGSFTGASRPTLVWRSSTDAVSGICGYVVTVDGTDSSLVGTSTSFSPSTALADGSHTWTVRSVDCVGNTSASAAAASFSVDTTAPDRIAFTSPSDGAWLGSTQPVVTWTASTDSGAGVSGYSVTLDTAAQASTTRTSFTPVAPLSAGSHCVAVASLDNVGNAGAAVTVCFKIDLTPPSAPSLASPAADGLTGPKPTLRWNTATDSGSGVCNYIPIVDSVELPQQSGTSVTLTTALSEGMHSWTVRAVDCVGNIGAPQIARSLTVDLTPPLAVTLLSPAADGWINESQPTLRWATTQDTGSGVCSYTVTLDGSPTVLASTRNELALTAPLPEGSHTWTVIATDCAGNVSAIQSPAVPFSIDLTPPSEVSFSSPEPGSWLSEAQPTITWNDGRDVGSGIAAVVVTSEDGETTLAADATRFTVLNPLGDGEHCVTVQLQDLAGNLSAGVTDCFNIDRTAPGVPVAQSPISSQFVRTTTPNFTWVGAQDSGSGICGGQLTIDTAAPIDVTGNSGQATSVLAEGWHSWRIAAVDCAGNVGAMSAPESFLVDVTAPFEIEVSVPVEGEWLDTARPLIAWTQAQDFGSGLAGYVMSIDEARPLAFSSAQNDYTPPTGLSEGQHCLSIHPEDRAGNAGTSATRCFSVDTTEPTAAALLSPATGACLGDARPTFTWGNASDDASGIDSYSLRVDSSVVSASIPSNQREAQVSTALSSGMHTWRVDATDLAGNVSQSDTGNFGVDTIAPTCVVKTTALLSGGLEVRGLTSDVGCGKVARVELLVNDEPAIDAIVDSNGGWLANRNIAVESLLRLRCRVTDGVGLQGTSPAVNVSTAICFRPGACDGISGSCMVPDPGATCDDGQSCTTNDVCNQAGVCGGTPLDTPECAMPPDAGPVEQDGGVVVGADGGAQPPVGTAPCGCSGQGRSEGLLPVLMMLVLRLRRRRPEAAH